MWGKLADMDKTWVTAIKVTGPVGVVGFLAGILMKYLFREDVISLFGSEKVFILAIVLISLLFIALITAILVHREPKKLAEKPPETTPQVNKTVVNRSKIDGDFVMGNKNLNSRNKNDQ